MSNRRVFSIEELKAAGERVIAYVEGLEGEEFETEVYQPYGFSSNPDDATDYGATILSQINDDADNHICHLPSGSKLAAVGTTLIYYGDTELVLSENGISIAIPGGKFFNITAAGVSTNLNVTTTGTVTASDVIFGPLGTRLSTHTHTTPSGPSGPPQ